MSEAPDMRRATPQSDPTLQTLRPLAHTRQASEEDTPQHTSEPPTVCTCPPGNTPIGVHMTDDCAVHGWPTARELLGRMKADGLITQRRDGSYALRSYGRDALLALSAIHLQSGGKR